jgi:hypothetical protein
MTLPQAAQASEGHAPGPKQLATVAKMLYNQANPT